MKNVTLKCRFLSDSLHGNTFGKSPECWTQIPQSNFCWPKLVIGAVRSNLDFGPVVKPLGITVKKEVGKVVESSDVVRSQVTREYWKRGKSPGAPNWPQKGGPKNFWISKFWDFSNLLWRGASVDVGFYCIIVYFWRQNVVAERGVKCTHWQQEEEWRLEDWVMWCWRYYSHVIGHYKDYRSKQQVL